MADDLNVVRVAVLKEAELTKQLESYTNAEIKAFLDTASVPYESDNNKATLCALLRHGPVGNNAEKQETPKAKNSEDSVQAVSVFSHNEACSRIKDDGKVYAKGEEYHGKNADSLISTGAVVAVYVEKPEDEVHTEGSE